jgi:phage/plasmid-like protein (TIGR03299 family)
MSHLVETMAYAGSTPWHGLGNKLSKNQPLEVWADQAGMNWQIEESPIQYITGNNPMMGELKEYPDSKVLYRSDTLDPLSVVGNRYKAVQPREILEFYRDLTDHAGFELETAGVLKGGRKLWALAKTGQSSTLKGNDQTNGYVLLATACDGSMATTAQFTSIRVVCNNTLSIALQGNSPACVKVRHSTSFDANKVKRELGISVNAWSSFMDEMKELSNRKINTSEAHQFISTVFSLPSSPNANQRAMKRVEELYNGHGHGSLLESSKGTAYGLLNAVTEYVDHERKARSNDFRLDSAWFGQGAKLKQQALTQALELVS